MKDAIYLVLDMMNDLVHADGVNGKAAYGEQVRTRHVLENTRRALDKARAAGVPRAFAERTGLQPSELADLRDILYGGAGDDSMNGG